MRLTKPTVFFIVTGLFFGLIFVVLNPPGFGLDERAHFIRAYEVSKGHLAPTRVGADNHLGAMLPINLTDFVYASTSDLSDNSVNGSILKRHDSDFKRYYPYFHQTFSLITKDDPVSNNQLTGTFAANPIGYIPLAAPIALGSFLKLSVLHIMYLTRLTNLIIYMSLVYLAIIIMPKYKWLMATVALMPTALFQASTISLDPLINASSFLLFSLLVDLWHAKTRPVSWIKDASIAVLLILLVITKVPYIVLLFPFLFVSNQSFRSKTEALIWKVIWLLIPVTIGLLWFMTDNSMVQSSVSSITSGNFGGQVSFIKHSPLGFISTLLKTFFDSVDGYFASMIGWIGDRFVGIAILPLAVLSGISLTVASLIQFDEAQPTDPENLPRNKLVNFLTVLAGIVTISLGLYLTFTPVGYSRILGIQGRYFIPFIPLFMSSIASLLPFKLKRNRVVAISMITIPVLILLLATAIVYAIVNY